MTIKEALDSGVLSFSRVCIPASLETYGNPADFDSAIARILIVRLSTLKDTDQSTSHLFLFGECRKALPGAFIDFAFLPTLRDRHFLDNNGLPWFFGISSGKKLMEFDLVLISNSFSLELLNLPYLFLKNHVPPLASERRAMEMEKPVFLIGGSNASASGSIINQNGDSFADGLFFGEAEGLAYSEDLKPENSLWDDTAVIPRLLSILFSDEKKTLSMKLENAGSISGFLPITGDSFCKHRIQVRRAPANSQISVKHPLLNNDEASTTRLQISFGCPAFCSFCFEGWDKKPYREIELDNLIATALQKRILYGAENLEVCSFNFNVYSAFPQLAIALNRIFPNVDFMSQRLDVFMEDPLLASFESALGKRTFTFGIEGISGRMRAYMNKNLPDDKLIPALAGLLQTNPREIKLFFIISGFENENDFSEFASFSNFLKSFLKTNNLHVRLIFSFGWLVRMPNTPLSFSIVQIDENKWKTIAERCQTIVKSVNFEWRMAHEWKEFIIDQELMAGHDILIDALLETASRGFVYDGKLPKDIIKIIGKKSDSVKTASRLFFPEGPVSSDILKKYHEKADSFLDTGSCLGKNCLGCGACRSGEKANIENYRQLKITSSNIDSINKLMNYKNKAFRLLILLDLPRSLYGATASFLSSWFLRECFRISENSANFILSAKEILFSRPVWFSTILPAFYGQTIFEIKCLDIEKTVKSMSMIFPSGKIILTEKLPEKALLRIETKSEVPVITAIRSFIGKIHLSATELSESEQEHVWNMNEKSGKRKSYSRIKTCTFDNMNFIQAECRRGANVIGLIEAMGLKYSPMSYSLSVFFPEY